MTEVSWNLTKFIGTMGCITTKNSIDLKNGVVGNGRKDFPSALAALVSHEMVTRKWLAQACMTSLERRGGSRRVHRWQHVELMLESRKRRRKTW